jgi:hypothetical protein
MQEAVRGGNSTQHAAEAAGARERGRRWRTASWQSARAKHQASTASTCCLVSCTRCSSTLASSADMSCCKSTNACVHACMRACMPGIQRAMASKRQGACLGERCTGSLQGTDACRRRPVRRPPLSLLALSLSHSLSWPFLSRSLSLSL